MLIFVSLASGFIGGLLSNQLFVPRPTLASTSVSENKSKKQMEQVVSLVADNISAKNFQLVDDQGRVVMVFKSSGVPTITIDSSEDPQNSAKTEISARNILMVYSQVAKLNGQQFQVAGEANYNAAKVSLTKTGVSEPSYMSNIRLQFEPYGQFQSDVLIHGVTRTSTFEAGAAPVVKNPPLTK
jgi:hypothetical protein